jgi:ubiquinone/menaquinone biosynthesis C-methylase UbiE
MDTAREFNGMALVYAKGRPAYADTFIDELYKKYGLSDKSIIADVGSGTGKFAKQIIEQGSFVYCVEPNEDMRNQAIQDLRKYSNYTLVGGDAANTNLQDHSVDFVTAAQAFHWFDVVLFKHECRRILKPGGKVFLIWNMRDMDSKLNQNCYETYKKYCPKFNGFSRGLQRNDEKIKSFFDHTYEVVEYDNPLCYDKDTFLNRSLSSSYSLKKQDINYGEFVNNLELIFDEYANDGFITMSNKTDVYIGMVE